MLRITYKNVAVFPIPTTVIFFSSRQTEPRGKVSVNSLSVSSSVLTWIIQKPSPDVQMIQKPSLEDATLSSLPEMW